MLMSGYDKEGSRVTKRRRYYCVTLTSLLQHFSEPIICLLIEFKRWQECEGLSVLVGHRTFVPSWSILWAFCSAEQCLRNRTKGLAGMRPCQPHTPSLP